MVFCIFSLGVSYTWIYLFILSYSLGTSHLELLIWIFSLGVRSSEPIGIIILRPIYIYLY